MSASRGTGRSIRLLGVAARAGGDNRGDNRPRHLAVSCGADQADSGTGRVKTGNLPETPSSISRPQTLLLGAAMCLLLIGAANLANFFLVRCLGREREMAVRTPLGATRNRLLRELTMESAALGLAAGVLSVGVAVLGSAVARTRTIDPASARSDRRRWLRHRFLRRRVDRDDVHLRARSGVANVATQRRGVPEGRRTRNRIDARSPSLKRAGHPTGRGRPDADGGRSAPSREL